MLSNLVFQLKEYNALSKMDDVLKEVPIVRRDLGYPPLVTPMSQIVGTQAVMNVITGNRYGMLIKELENYVRGFYGKPPSDISRDLMKKVKPSDVPKELSFNSIPEDAKILFKKDEDALTYLLFPQLATSFLKGEMKLVAESSEVEKRKEVRWFHIKVGNEDIDVKVIGEE
jgi:pyruvate/oxaloacetate carboxyltransferase